MAESKTKSSRTTTPASGGDSGLEAGIIFLMVIVFLGIIFINGISSPSEIENDILQAQNYMDHGEFSAASARLDEVLRRYPGHTAADELKDTAERRLTEQRAAAESQRRSIEGDLSAARARVAELTTESADKDRRITEISTSLASAFTEVANLQNKLSDREAAAEKAARELAEARAVVAAKSKELADQQHASSQELSSRDQQMTNLRKDLDSANRRADELENAQRKTTQDLSTTAAELEDKRAALAALQKRADADRDRVEELGASVEAAEKSIADSAKALTKIVAAAEKLQKSGDHVAALGHFESVLILDPKNEKAIKGAEACKKAIEAAKKAAEVEEAPAEQPAKEKTDE